jgi:hypothetical protein
VGTHCFYAQARDAVEIFYFISKLFLAHTDHFIVYDCDIVLSAVVAQSFIVKAYFKTRLHELVNEVLIECCPPKIVGSLCMKLLFYREHETGIIDRSVDIMPQDHNLSCFESWIFKVVYEGGQGVAVGDGAKKVVFVPLESVIEQDSAKQDTSGGVILH